MCNSSSSCYRMIGLLILPLCMAGSLPQWAGKGPWQHSSTNDCCCATANCKIRFSCWHNNVRFSIVPTTGARTCVADSQSTDGGFMKIHTICNRRLPHVPTIPYETKGSSQLHGRISHFTPLMNCFEGQHNIKGLCSLLRAFNLYRS